MPRSLRAATVLPATMATILALCSCKGELIAPAQHDIRDYVTSVATADGSVTASFVPGDAAVGGAVPAVNAVGTSAMILGGGALRSLSSATAFTRVIVAIVGAEGYWQLTLPASLNAQDVILTLAQQVPNATFTVEYAAATSTTVGPFDSELVSILTVGTGDVQVSVAWDAESDVDLHVVEPGGTDIYYGNDVVPSGGTLDLDSNAGCSIDGKKNENVTWQQGSLPPRGTYVVRLDYWDSCSVTATKYVVTVRVSGQLPRSFSGTFTGPGDHGGAGSGILITTFTY
jgi:hypothetical protein